MKFRKPPVAEIESKLIHLLKYKCFRICFAYTVRWKIVLFSSIKGWPKKSNN